MTEATLLEIKAEIARADVMWGTEFDDKNTLNDWIAYANIYLGQAANMKASQTEQYTNLLKAAGLIVNAATRVKSGNIQARHYD